MMRSSFVACALGVMALAQSAQAAGVLTPKGAAEQPIKITQHHVDVTLNNGFARTEVTQTFFNPNGRALEALYSFPMPRSASLSEVTVFVNEQEIHGEVLAKEQARQVYEEERNGGADAALAEKNEFYSFEFAVSPVRPQAETRIRFVYYQPLDIDSGVGRYVYPLDPGGTDEAALGFWDTNTKVEGSFSARVELKSAAAVQDVRMPGFQNAAQIRKVEEGRYVAELNLPDATLDQDLVFYYRLADDLPAQVELIPYRADGSKPGTFMLVVTPGMDLQPIQGGADYVFVLDVSGSMQGKIGTLANGVQQALGKMRPEDRVRVIAFNDSAQDVSNGWQAMTPENAQRLAETVKNLQPNGSTNVYDGLDMALANLDDDRAASVVLVTDGVTNTGVVDPKAFHGLMKKQDVRVFGFLMGNSANWPLMRTIADASGGFYSSVSNADDIVGQILLAKDKVRSEALHDAELKIGGVKTFDVTREALGKVYHGQQLVMFGRYEGGGDATVTLTGRLTGEDKTYRTTFRFPDQDTENPEIERLWALAQIEEIEVRRSIGDVDEGESREAIRDLGLAYQLVTDETSMVVLSDQAFEQRGIKRWNRDRVAVERAAQAQRAAQPVAVSRRVDAPQPMFEGRKAPRVGGGAIDPLSASLLGLMALGLAMRRRRA
jgi:Ca-activated chloride channel family protein